MIPIISIRDSGNNRWKTNAKKPQQQQQQQKQT